MAGRLHPDSSPCSAVTCAGRWQKPGLLNYVGWLRGAGSQLRGPGLACGVGDVSGGASGEPRSAPQLCLLCGVCAGARPLLGP